MNMNMIDPVWHVLPCPFVGVDIFRGTPIYVPLKGCRASPIYWRYLARAGCGASISASSRATGTPEPSRTKVREQVSGHGFFEIS